MSNYMLDLREFPKFISSSHDCDTKTRHTSKDHTFCNIIFTMSNDPGGIYVNYKNTASTPPGN